MKYKDMVFTKGKDGKFKAKTITVTTKMKVACELCYPKGEELGWVGNLLLIRFRKKFILLTAPFHKDEVHTFATKPVPEPKNSDTKEWLEWAKQIDTMKLSAELGLEGSYNLVKALIRTKKWKPSDGSVNFYIYESAARLVKKWEKKRA